MTTDADGLQKVRLADYEDIAAEYYDPKLHPTCASLRELSSNFLVPRLVDLAGTEAILETGAGRSIVAPLWLSLGHNLSKVILLDKSHQMIAHSSNWQSQGASLIIKDAERTGLPGASFDVIVSSLGDPYNTRAFWLEIARLLRPGGLCHFTTPALEWAAEFRSSGSRAAAEFMRSDGTVLWMASQVLSEPEQAQLFSHAGLEILDTEALTQADLSAAPAPKLLCVSKNEAIVRGYSLRR